MPKPAVVIDGRVFTKKTAQDKEMVVPFFLLLNGWDVLIEDICLEVDRMVRIYKDANGWHLDDPLHREGDFDFAPRDDQNAEYLRTEIFDFFGSVGLSSNDGYDFVLEYGTPGGEFRPVQQGRLECLAETGFIDLDPQLLDWDENWEWIVSEPDSEVGTINRLKFTRPDGKPLNGFEKYMITAMNQLATDMRELVRS